MGSGFTHYAGGNRRWWKWWVTHSALQRQEIIDILVPFIDNAGPAYNRKRLSTSIM